MKKCIACGKRKPIDDFYQHPRMLDGYLNKCKKCCIASSAKNRKDNAEYYKAYRRSRSRDPKVLKVRTDYQKTDRGRQKHNAASSKYYHQNKYRHRARMAVRDAILSGELRKMPCERCGDLSVHAHHESYKRPLDVTWLCKWCHVDRHLEMKDAGIQP